MRRSSPPPSVSPTTGRRDSSSSKTPETNVGARANVASRACDACRARRRKCHFDDAAAAASPLAGSQAQCRDCIRLGIACSFLVPTRSRGPKRRKRLPSMSDKSDGESQLTARRDSLPAQGHHEPVLIVPAAEPSLAGTSHPRSPFSATHHGPSPHAVSPSASGPRFPTDELCSRALINIMMADYLDLVYPLVPVVHRPSFRHDLASNRDLADPDFFALLMSLVALTVGLLPSRFRAYRSVDPEAGTRFATRTAFINCCAELCTRQRGANYWDHINLRKWAVCYVMSVACFQTGQVNRSRMFDVEYLQVSRLLGLHRIQEYEGLNCIETQLRKKAFWMLFYGYAHTRVQSGRWERLTYFNPGELREVNFEALMPLDVDDEQIFETRIVPPVTSPLATPETPRTAAEPRQPFTLISGFILHSRVFLKGLREAIFSVGCACELRQSPAERLARMRDLLQEMRYMLDDAPGPMRQWAASAESYDDAAAAAAAAAAVPPAAAVVGTPETPGYDSPASQAAEPGYSRTILAQAEIMRANLHVTHLWLQSLLLEQVDVVLQQQQGEDVAAALKGTWAEREDVCRQMLHLLHSIPYVHLEPNGLYLAYKVRDVAVTLLNCPFEAHERPARRAAEYMRDFTRALSRLDRSEIVNTNSLKSWVDVDREMALG